MTQTVAIICNTALHVLRSRTKLIAALQSSGARVLIISPADAAVSALLELGIVHEHVDISQYGIDPLAEVKAFLHIRKILGRYRPAVCLCYTIKANTIGSLAAHSFGIPVINNIAGLGRVFEERTGGFRVAVTVLYAVSLWRSTRVFFQNADDMQFFLRRSMVRKDLARRIPGSGVDLGRFDPSLECPRDPVFLFMGRLLVSKGAKMYVDAARKMIEEGTNATFLLAGERLDDTGYLSKSEVEEFSRLMGCTYLGQLSPEQVPGLIASCSFFVLPSFYGEGVPRTLLEAGAGGRPIITTDSVGCRDVIRDEINGLKINPRNHGQLLAAMREAAGMDRKTVVALGCKNREIVEAEFDEKFVIQAYLNEYERVIASLGPAASSKVCSWSSVSSDKI